MANNQEYMQNTIQGIMVRKSNEFVSGKYKSSLLENKLMAFALTRLRIVNGCPVADMYKNDIINILGCKENNIYRKLKRTAADMSGHVICLEDGRGNFQCFSMVNNASYVNGIFTIQFNQEMAPYVSGLKQNFTTYELAALARFEYNHSYRLYELLKKEIYKSNPQVNNGVVEKTFGVNELRCELGLINMDDKDVKRAINEKKSWDDIFENIAKDRQFITWYDFRRHVLDVAQNELREKSDICFEYIADGKGKGSKVRNVTFYIKKNSLDVIEQQEISNKENAILQRNADYEEMTKDLDEHPLPSMMQELIGHNNLTESDIKLFYELAEYNATKVEDAVTLADSQNEISNYVGWIRKCIQDGYEEATPVVMGSSDSAERIKQIRELMTNDAINIATRAWMRTTQKDDYPDFLKYCEEEGLTEEALNAIYEDTEKIDLYTQWKLHYKTLS